MGCSLYCIRDKNISCTKYQKLATFMGIVMMLWAHAIERISIGCNFLHCIFEFMCLRGREMVILVIYRSNRCFHRLWKKLNVKVMLKLHVERELWWFYMVFLHQKCSILTMNREDRERKTNGYFWSITRIQWHERTPFK